MALSVSLRFVHFIDERLATECPAFLRRCEERGLRYSNVMPGTNDEESGMGRSWPDTLGVTTQEAAEARLSALGYEWEWQEGDCLRATTPPLPAVKTLEGLREMSVRFKANPKGVPRASDRMKAIKNLVKKVVE